MNIAFLSYEKPPQVSGGYLYNERIRDELSRLGHRCCEFALQPDLERGVFVKMIRDNAIDMVVEDELCFRDLGRVNAWLKQIGVPKVALVHVLSHFLTDRFYLKRWYRYREGRYLSSVNGMVFVSDANLRSTDRLLRLKQPATVVTPGKDHLVSNVTPEELAEKCFASGPLRLLTVGHIAPHKGLHLLLDALAGLPFDFHLTVAGGHDGHASYAKNLRDRTSALGISDRVEFTGVVPLRDLPSFYAKHHVFILSSFYESFSIAAMEALTFGLPVVTWAKGGPRDYIDNGHNGFLLSRPDADLLRDYLSRLQAARAVLHEMALNALESAAAFPDWRDSALNLQNFLQEIASDAV